MNSCYWAKFEEQDNALFRFDTRVYINPIQAPSDSDFCIGAVVGKNPGSAKPSRLNSCQLQEIYLDGDNMLPTIKSMCKKAFELSKKPIMKNMYIQVLNLIYICNKDLNIALKEIHKYQMSEGQKICSTENSNFHFIFYVWGGDNDKLNAYKHRFKEVNTQNHFFYEKNKRELVKTQPNEIDFAKHPQGLSHDLVVPYLSELIKELP